jgi:branched-chain amino acid transport system permease protein
MKRSDRILFGFAGLAVCGAAIAVFAGMSGFWVRTLTLLFLMAAMSQAWNITGGYAGYTSFGNAAFFGSGAYVTSILITRKGFHWPVVPAVLAGGVFCVVLACIIGTPLLRLKGHYFAVATLGIAQALKEFVGGWDSVTGGGLGINLPINSDPNFYKKIYLIMLALVVVATALTFFISRTRLGYGWVAIRENEQGAKALGINATLYKVTALALSALISGIIGGVYVLWNGTASPDGLFDSQYSQIPIVLAVLGGVGTVMGPVLGAIAYQLLLTLLLFRFPGWQPSMIGGIIVVSIIFMPRGIYEYITGRRSFGLASLLENPRSNQA